MSKFFPISPMMVSMDNEKHIAKIPQIKTDSIILNLEDGVGDKLKALENTKKFLTSKTDLSKKYIVRVNSLDSRGTQEIFELNNFFPDAIRIPKIETVSDVEFVNKIVAENIDIHLSIETKSSWLNLSKLKVSNKITTFYLGILDLIADLGMSQNILSPENPTIQYILSHFLITSKALDIQPISFVFQDYKNRELFLKWLKLEKDMGYKSKGALSPTQAKDIQDILGFSVDEVEKAKYIKNRFEEMSNKGVRGFADENFGFIDEPIYKGALAILSYE